MRRTNPHLLLAAATLTSNSSCQAFSVMVTPPFTTPTSFSLDQVHSSPPRYYYNHQSSRLYSYNNNNNSNNQDGGFLGKVKSMLPTKWFGTDEEKKAQIERQRVKDEVSGGLDAMLRDAPLGIKMMGKVMAPLLSKAASSMAESMAEQQALLERVLDDTRQSLANDPDVVSMLGGPPIQVGTPFSQSSSTTSINGQTQTSVQLLVPVQGQYGSGTARVSATAQGVSQILLEVAGGPTLNVNLNYQNNSGYGGYNNNYNSFPGSSSQGRRRGGSNFDNDDIIEAEIVDKDTNNNNRWQ